MSMLLTGITILLLGDSHMSLNGQLISTLPDTLVQQGAKVFSYGACGVTPSGWLKKKKAYCGAFRVNVGPVRMRPGDIATTQSVNELINKHHPNLIVLVMGDTMGSYDQKSLLKTWIWQEVTSLTQEIKTHETRCVWVGPAWGQDGGIYQKRNARAKELSDYLSTVVAPCTYIDSLTLSKVGEWSTVDGQHLGKAGYEGWAKGITDTITSPEILPTLK